MIKNTNPDFNILKGQTIDIVNFLSDLKLLGFDNSKDFLLWVANFLPDWTQVGCGSCCRGKLPEFIIFSQSETGIGFNDIIKEIWNTFSEKQKEKAFLNYEHYFALYGYRDHNKKWIEMFQDFRMFAIGNGLSQEQINFSRPVHIVVPNQEKLSIDKKLTIEERFNLYLKDGKFESFKKYFGNKFNDEDRIIFIERFNQLDKNLKEKIIRILGNQSSHPYLKRLSKTLNS